MIETADRIAEVPVGPKVRPESTIPKPVHVSVGSGESWESLIGGRLFTWAGGVVLVLAFAFFVVWSWVKLDLSPSVRVALMHALGLSVIGVGTWLKDRKLAMHSGVVYGIGVFGLYASALAMTHLYQLGGESRELWGFIDAALITALAIYLSLRNRDVGIILLGAAGGYLTPLLMLQSTDPWVSFVYLAFLNMALLISGHVGRWDFLKPLAWIVTAMMFCGMFLFHQFSSPQQGTALLALHAALFGLAFTLPHLWLKSPSRPVGNLLLVVNSLAFFVGYAGLHLDDVSSWPAVCLLLLLLHAAASGIAFRQLERKDRLGRVHLALATLFLTLGLTIFTRETPQAWTTIWALEGLAFGLIGFWFRDRQLLVTACLAFGLTLLRAIRLDFFPPELSISSSWDPQPTRWFTLAAIMAVTGSGYRWLPRMAGANGPGAWLGKVPARLFAAGLMAVANLVLLTGMYLQFSDNLPILLTICAVDVGLIWLLAFVKNQEATRQYATTLGMGLILFGGVLMSLQFRELGDQWDNGSRIAFLSVALILGASGFQFWRKRNEYQADFDKSAHAVWTVAAHLFLLGVVTAEIQLGFSRSGGNLSATSWLVCGGAWSLYAASLITTGLRWRYPVMRVLGILLFCVAALLVLVQIRIGTGVLAEHWGWWTRVASLITGGLLIGYGLFYWLRRGDQTLALEQPCHAWLTTGGIVLMGVILTSEIATYFGPSAGTRSTQEMATYSVVWGLFAALLVVFGFLMRYPLPRFLGIGLLSLVMVKVFLVDLGQVELIIRVIALMILGLLLLGVSLLYQRFKTRLENPG